MLEGLVLPESLETIRRGAFNGCFGIGTIVCKGTMPAYIESGAFDGVAKDNFTLEVPESAVQQYQAAGGCASSSASQPTTSWYAARRWHAR